MLRAPLMAALLAAAGVAQADGASMLLGFDDDIAVLDGASGEAAALQRRGQPVPGVRSGPVALGAPSIQYEGGSASQRGARIVADPLRPGNQVLAFEVREPNVVLGNARKSRVQLNLYGNDDVREVHLSVRMLLDADLARLETMGRRIDWFTLSEWWNGAPWTSDAAPFRISVGLVRPAGEGRQPLRLGIEAQAMAAGRRDFRDSTVWKATDSAFDLPYGRWMRVEYYYREGDAESGRFAMAVTADDGLRRILADVRGPTRHPAAAGAGRGLSHLNPIKLYTSAAVTDHVRSQGGALRVLWDDLSVLACGAPPPGRPSDCANRWSVR